MGHDQSKSSAEARNESIRLLVPDQRDRRIKSVALAMAIVLHIVILLVNFPTMRAPFDPKKHENVIVVKKYVPPPPKIERRVVQQRQFTRKVPIPDPTPDEPEPIREPEPEIEPEPLPPDVEFLIGEPEAPPAPDADGPVLIGGAVSEPKKIHDVQPEYPEIARVSRTGNARVILAAVVLKDGTVSEVEVLRCNKPGFGFEESAVTAVQQWRYQPTMMGSRPVDVKFTILVDFDMI